MNKYAILAKNAKGYSQAGSQNNNWRGDSASYSAKHKRGANGTSKNGKGSKCTQCGSTENLHYVTVHGSEGKSHKTLCQSCHSKYDNQVKNTKK